MFRWQQAEGLRHAFKVRETEHLPVDEPFQTLCRLTVTPRRADIPALGGLMFDHTCLACEHVWLTSSVGAS